MFGAVFFGAAVSGAGVSGAAFLDALVALVLVALVLVPVPLVPVPLVPLILVELFVSDGLFAVDPDGFTDPDDFVGVVFAGVVSGWVVFEAPLPDFVSLDFVPVGFESFGGFCKDRVHERWSLLALS
ncbi:hypothetical protein [Microlunatus endophyticus]